MSNESGIVEAAPIQAEDYLKDGVLMCGKCHTSKQEWRKPLSLPFKSSHVMRSAEPKLRNISCQCEREAREAEDERLEKEQFMFRLGNCRREYGGISNLVKASTFDADDGNEQKVSQTCQKYVNQWEDMKKNNMGILFYGPVGTGKTFFASCISNALADSYVYSMVISFPRLLSLFQDSGNRQELIDGLQQFSLLVLDDLGAERDSSFALEQVFNVVDARIQSGLPVIVTTNLTLDEMREPPSMQLRRIYDRVLEMCPIRIKLTGESKRAVNAEHRKKLAQNLFKA